MYQCIIADDHLVERALLSSYIKKIPSLNLVAECKTGLEVLAFLKEQSIDIVFSDVDMPDLTGIELVKTLKNPPVFVFISSFPEYAAEGFNLDIIDFAVKPISFDRFVKAVNKSIEYIELKKTAAHSTASIQNENTEKMNELIKELKGMDIEAKDITTANYSIYPQYDWRDGEQILRGYVVSQNVIVKIRNLDLVGNVIEAAGSLGSNQIGGLSFTIDEPEALRQQAREKALQNATDKAAALAKIGNVKLGKLVSFSEGGSATPPIFYDRGMIKAEADSAGVATPTVEPGSQDIISNVTVTYEVL